MNCNKSSAYHLVLFEKLSSIYKIGMHVSAASVPAKDRSWC